MQLTSFSESSPDVIETPPSLTTSYIKLDTGVSSTAHPSADDVTPVRNFTNLGILHSISAQMPLLTTAAVVSEVSIGAENVTAAAVSAADDITVVTPAAVSTTHTVVLSTAEGDDESAGVSGRDVSATVSVTVRDVTITQSGEDYRSKVSTPAHDSILAIPGHSLMINNTHGSSSGNYIFHLNFFFFLRLYITSYLFKYGLILVFSRLFDSLLYDSHSTIYI